jgi:hypothetical protein
MATALFINWRQQLNRILVSKVVFGGRSVPKENYIPFRDSPLVRIGKAFALMEAVLNLARLKLTLALKLSSLF